MELALAVSLFLAPITTPHLPPECPDLRQFPRDLGGWRPLNEAYCEWCQGQASLSTDARWLYYWSEAKECAERYAALEYARRRWAWYVGINERNQPDLKVQYWEWYVDALDDLRWRLTGEEWSLGEIGPPVPLWRLR